MSLVFLLLLGNGAFGDTTELGGTRVLVGFYESMEERVLFVATGNVCALLRGGEGSGTVPN